MKFFSLQARTSFQLKVLLSVIVVMALLTAASIWVVNRRISAQLEQQAGHQLAYDIAIFKKFQENRVNGLITKYGGIRTDSRYRAFAHTATESPDWYRTANLFLTDQIPDSGAAIATCTFTPDASDKFASARLDMQIDARQFQARSAVAITRAFAGEPVTDTIGVGSKLFNVICVPVRDTTYNQIGVFTFGVEIGTDAVREIKLSGSDILLFDGGHIVASSLPSGAADPGLVSKFNELVTSEPNSAATLKIIRDKKHFISAAGHFETLKPSPGLGYLMLSSYEESWEVLRATQQMLMVVGLLGMGLSSAILWILIRKVTEPLRQLRDSSEAVGRGDFSKRVVVTSTDECGELAMAFNQMTENIKTSHEELEKTLETLKATQNQLIQSEKLSGIGEFVAGVAHELNNPLTSVMGFSELLQQSDMPEQQRRYLDVIFKSSKRCQKIVQSLLSFARRHAPERKVICVNEIVESAVEILQYQMRTSNIEVLTQLDPRLPATEVDPHQMQQVFLNVINNARQAMETHQTKGWLRITTESVDGRVRIIFQDNGPGIAPENLKRIFNPFFTTKEVGKGTGLGLSLCYGIVSEHGGTITPRSAPGEGATFVIELPITRQTAAVVEKTPAAAPAETTREGVGKRVLVIDDEDTILQMIREALTRNGYRVDIAHDGESALRRLSQYHYDLALCDWKMPGLNGEQVFDKLRETDPEMSKRIIFITGDVVNEKVQDFLKTRDKVCLSKPFTLGEFRSAINRVITPS